MIRHLEGDIRPESKYYPLLLKAKGDYARITGDKPNALRIYEKLEATAQSAFEKISNKYMLESIIASISTLYEIGEVGTAIRKSEKLIQLLDQYEEGTPPYWDRFKAVIYFNLALFYTASLQYTGAKCMIEKASEFTQVDLAPHMEYLKSIVLYYQGDWHGSEECLYHAIRGFRSKDNTKMLTKALLAQHTFIVYRPREYRGTLTVLENIILQGNEPCGETCRRNPMYHQIWNSTIENSLSSGDVKRAKQLLDAVFKFRHNNSKTRYLLSKYYQLTKNYEMFIQELKKAADETKFDDQSSDFEKGMTTLEYLKHTVTGEADRISQAQSNFQQSEVPRMLLMLTNLLPPPID